MRSAQGRSVAIHPGERMLERAEAAGDTARPREAAGADSRGEQPACHR